MKGETIYQGLAICLLLIWGHLPVMAASRCGDVSLDVNIKTDSSILLRQHATFVNKNQRTSDITAKVGFGIKSGAGLSNTNFNKGYPKPSVPVETAWKTCFMGGFLVKVPLYRKLYLQQEYLYAYIRGEAISEGVTYKLSYLSLPVLLKLKVIPKLALLAGPHLDLILQAKEDHNNTSIDLTKEIENRNVGAAAGVEYKLSNKIGIDVRFVQGVNHIGINKGTATKEFKLELIQLSVSLTPF